MVHHDALQLLRRGIDRDRQLRAREQNAPAFGKVRYAPAQCSAVHARRCAGAREEGGQQRCRGERGRGSELRLRGSGSVAPLSEIAGGEDGLKRLRTASRAQSGGGVI